MNELIFFAHIFCVLIFVLIALALGRGALIALLALQGVLSNLLVVKQIKLFGMSVTCSDVFAIGGILSLNLLQEFYGKEVAKKAIQTSMLCLLFYALMSQIHLVYFPSTVDTTQSSFVVLFSSSARLIFASIATFYLVSQFDLRFFSLLKGSLSKRILLSMVVSQLIDTVLFSFLGLYGLIDAVWDVILVSCIIKWAIILISAPFTLFAKRFMAHDVSI